jgi:Abortive infection alpha
MVEPIITTGAVLVGAGTWFADKIFGPSAEKLGQSLSVYASDRVRKIFSLASQKAEDEQQINQLPPGYLFKLVQAASFSDESDDITEMWANLLIESSKCLERKHTTYVDIMEKLGHDEAEILNNLIGEYAPKFYSQKMYNTEPHKNLQRGYYFDIADGILKEKMVAHFDEEMASDFEEKVLKFKTVWPSLITFLDIPYALPVNQQHDRDVGKRTYTTESIKFDILIRQQLVEKFNVDFIAGFQMEAAGVMPTPLGLDFIKVCRGEKS